MTPQSLATLKEDVTARLLRYVAFDTGARFDTPSPSSPGQRELGALLVEEMRAIGLTEIEVDGVGIVTATLPATVGYAERPTIGYLAHLDTSPEASGAGIRPRIIRRYDGAPIQYPAVLGLEISPATLDELAGCVGHDLVVTDGTTLLGADDKSGVAAIMAACAYLAAHPEIPRPRIRVGMTVDEEIGQGILHFDIERFGAACAYTLDDDAAGTLAIETFSADLAIVRVRGKNSHPGTARGRMANALRVVSEVVAAIPPPMTPETTDARQGFLHAYEISGTVAHAEAHVLVRDFATAGLAAKEDLLRTILSVALARHPGAEGEIEVRKQYRNMADRLRKAPDVAARAEAAIRRLGLTPKRTEIRGGTDGSQLTERGLPCPNLFAGWHNAHAVTEWACLDDMALSAATLVLLAEEWSRP